MLDELLLLLLLPIDCVMPDRDESEVESDGDDEDERDEVELDDVEAGDVCSLYGLFINNVAESLPMKLEFFS